VRECPLKMGPVERGPDFLSDWECALTGRRS
jgi:hypothetical protein